MNLSSQEFIDKLKAKDHDALNYIINEYNEALFKAAIKLGLGIDQAEEVVQATWITLFEKVQNFQGRSHIRTYVFGILYNKVKELWRSNKKYTHDYTDEHLDKIFNEDGNYAKTPLDPSHWVESSEFMQILHEELEKLPEKQKLAFILKEVNGETTEDICNIIGVSVTNLGVLIYRAKNNLRARIEKRFTEDPS